MQSNLLFFNIDELLYRFHIYVAEPIIQLVTFRWLFRDSGAARAMEEGELGIVEDAGFFDRYFISPFYRLFASRPSQEYDSIHEQLNPTAERGLGDILWGVLFGAGDKESVLEIIFGSFLFWLIILGVICWLLAWYFKHKVKFMQDKHALLYDIAHTGNLSNTSDNKAIRWQTVIEKVATDDPSNWKIAIMDADILLDEVLLEQGYSGEGVAERLQSARAEGKLSTLQYASQAHGVRNKIAHDSGFVLSARNAKTTIAMYERFFNELFSL